MSKRFKESELVSIGFAFDEGDESTITDNFVEDQGREPNKKDWDIINKDIRKVEMNILKWFKNTFEGASDEGHDNMDRFVGSVLINPDKNYDILLQNHNDYHDERHGGTTVYCDTETFSDNERVLTAGCSDFVSCLYPQFSFYEVPTEYFEARGI